MLTSTQRVLLSSSAANDWESGASSLPQRPDAKVVTSSDEALAAFNEAAARGSVSYHGFDRLTVAETEPHARLVAIGVLLAYCAETGVKNFIVRDESARTQISQFLSGLPDDRYGMVRFRLTHRDVAVSVAFDHHNTQSWMVRLVDARGGYVTDPPTVEFLEKYGRLKR